MDFSYIPELEERDSSEESSDSSCEKIASINDIDFEMKSPIKKKPKMKSLKFKTSSPIIKKILQQIDSKTEDITETDPKELSSIIYEKADEKEKGRLK